MNRPRLFDVRFFSSASDADRARRPTDMVLLAASLVVFGLAALIHQPTPTRFERGVAAFVEASPGLFNWFWEIAYALLFVWPVTLIVAALIGRGRLSLLRDQLLGGGIAAAVVALNLNDAAELARGLRVSEPPAVFPAARLALGGSSHRGQLAAPRQARQPTGEMDRGRRVLRRGRTGHRPADRRGRGSVDRIGLGRYRPPALRLSGWPAESATGRSFPPAARGRANGPGVRRVAAARVGGVSGTGRGGEGAHGQGLWPRRPRWGAPGIRVEQPVVPGVAAVQLQSVAAGRARGIRHTVRRAGRCRV